MCAMPAQVAGVERIALATPPGPDGGAARGAGRGGALRDRGDLRDGRRPGDLRARLRHRDDRARRRDRRPRQRLGPEAKRAVSGTVGIDSLAGPSELMVIAGHDTDPEWAALDLCAQAEHGDDAAAGRSRSRSTSSTRSPRRPSASRRSGRGVRDAPLALVHVPDSATPPSSPTPSPPSTSSSSRRTPRSSPSGSPPRAASSPDAAARPPSATTSPAPTTCCRPAAPGRFTGPLGPGAFRRRSPRWRSTRRRRDLAPTSTRSPAPRASPSTPNRP